MSETGNTIGRLFGYILITAGGLWVLLAGGCTVMFVLSGLNGIHDAAQAAGMSGMIALAVLLGFAGAAPGIVLFALGGLLVRRARRQTTP